MSPSQLNEVETILHHVRGLPAPLQLSLATRILQSLEALNARPAKPIKSLLGLLAASGPPPEDEECERMIAEERLRKYS